MIRLRPFRHLAMLLLLGVPMLAQSDQNNPRLDELFEVLRSSQDEARLVEVESEIWEIWYDSGSEEIDALMARGASSARAGNLRAAESIYSEVIEQKPNFSEGWNRRATIRYYRNDYEGSLADIEETLRLEPRHFGAIWGLGMILGWQQDYERAILAFERLLEIKPNAGDARPRIELLKQEMAKEAV
jgi:tetratricopeptide (TPR) repeat protein